MATMHSFLFQDGSFYDPATGTVVQLGLVDPDSFGFATEPLRQSLMGGKQATALRRKTGIVTIFDENLLTALRALESKHVRWVMAGLPNTLWHRDSFISINQTIERRDGFLGFDVQIEARESLKDEKILHLGNLLDAAEWDNNTWEFEYPIAGIELALGYTPDEPSYITLRALDYAGALLEEETQFVDEGRGYVTLKTPPGTYTVYAAVQDSETGDATLSTVGAPFFFDGISEMGSLALASGEPLHTQQDEPFSLGK